MFVIYSEVVLFLILFHASDCERRITGGKIVASDKSYVVYLIKASIAPVVYDTWLCGGALVTKDFIVTSAACVEDVQFMYAIAGYRKYVPDNDIQHDECIKNTKKKVIFTCIPITYEFDYHQLDKWSHIDIALVRVESPFDFNDVRYQIMCSYTPTTIPINYDIKHQMANTDAMVLGWGHSEYWRTRGDKTNYNLERMHYAATLILDKQTCMEEYKVYPNMVQIVDKYMICTLETGNIDENGEAIVKSRANATGCAVGRQGKVMGFKDEECKEEMKVKHNQGMADGTRRDNNMKVNGTIKEIINKTSVSNNTFSLSRRSGICQNDHGGPLVTWVGSHEILIGVASVFKITEDNKCVGPFLYTSTHCNGAFLDCVLHSEFGPTGRLTQSGRRTNCDGPPNVRGFDTVEKYISWKDHPDGPADNERSKTRGRNGVDRFQTQTEHKIKDRFETYQGFPVHKEKPWNFMFRANEKIPAKKSKN